jgi:hypothetical protein
MIYVRMRLRRERRERGNDEIEGGTMNIIWL